MYMLKEFTNMYENCCWGDDQNSIYKGNSGGGSDYNYNINEYVHLYNNLLQIIIFLQYVI